MATTALPAEEQVAEKSVLWSWLTTVDHKRIGILYGATAFFFFLVGGLEALIIRLQLAKPENTLVSAETYNQLFTMHGTTMIFLGVMPLSAMFFNYMIPLQLGARDVAFPRLNAFSYWVFLAGGLIIERRLALRGGAERRLVRLRQPDQQAVLPGLNIDFWTVGLQILGVASLAAAVNFFVTIINLRAKGMKMMYMPMFVWMSFITQILLLLALPGHHRRADPADDRPDLRDPLLRASPAAATRSSGSTCSGSSGIPRSTS